MEKNINGLIKTKQKDKNNMMIKDKVRLRSSEEWQRWAMDGLWNYARLFPRVQSARAGRHMGRR